MHRSSLLSTALAILMLACTPAFAADEANLLEEARNVATSVPPRLLQVLQQEIERGGPAGAIAACRDFAPQIARKASEESGWAIRRVSLKNRNPRAVPDDWERAVLEQFDQRAAAGASPAALETGAAVGNEYRYMKALPTQPLCLGCHGAEQDLDPAVRARLEELYPDDRATGYRVGDIRGAITLRKPLPQP